MIVRAVEWRGGPDTGCLRILDQTLLPRRTVYRNCRDAGSVWRAIRTLQVRGAPAIGVAAAFGAYLGARALRRRAPASFRAGVRAVLRRLGTSRPTAVNLYWALERMEAALARPGAATVPEHLERLFVEATAVLESDRDTCRRIGEHGAGLLPRRAVVLTHCNAGALATAGTGTALAVLYAAADRGKSVRVFSDETRPVLQGARLTAWELRRHGIDVTVICDGAAALALHRFPVDCVIVGADRIAANGDTANKIGTFGLAVNARERGIPFYVAAPLSTFDPTMPDGSRIPIEERPGEEVTEFGGVRVAPRGIKTWNPAFDVTPSRFVSAFVTEVGILRPPFSRSLRAALRARS